MNEMDHIANAANLNPQQQLLVINHLEELLNGNEIKFASNYLFISCH